jgi:hypothetical protein
MRAIPCKFKGNGKPPTCQQFGVDPKVAADQRGHGIGVSLDVYTISALEQKRQAVKKLESAVIRKTETEAVSASLRE